MPSAGRQPTALCATAVTATAGRSSCRVSWFMVHGRVSCVVVRKWSWRAPWSNCGAERRRKSSLDTNKRGGNEKRRSSGSGAQVATRIATRSPEGESSPLGGGSTSPGHFQRTRLENPVSCKFATKVRESPTESPGLHRHAQMAAAAARLPLQSRETL